MKSESHDPMLAEVRAARREAEEEYKQVPENERKRWWMSRLRRTFKNTGSIYSERAKQRPGHLQAVSGRLRRDSVRLTEEGFGLSFFVSDCILD